MPNRLYVYCAAGLQAALVLSERDDVFSALRYANPTLKALVRVGCHTATWPSERVAWVATRELEALSMAIGRSTGSAGG